MSFNFCNRGSANYTNHTVRPSLHATIKFDFFFPPASMTKNVHVGKQIMYM